MGRVKCRCGQFFVGQLLLCPVCPQYLSLFGGGGPAGDCGMHGGGGSGVQCRLSGQGTSGLGGRAKLSNLKTFWVYPGGHTQAHPHTQALILSTLISLTHSHLFIYIRTPSHAHAHTHTHTHTQVFIYIDLTHTHAFVHTHTHLFTLTSIYLH